MELKWREGVNRERKCDAMSQYETTKRAFSGVSYLAFSGMIKSLVIVVNSDFMLLFIV